MPGMPLRATAANQGQDMSQFLPADHAGQSASTAIRTLQETTHGG
jgi:hypothetical protein